MTIADYFAISEEKLNALPADKFQELREKGVLAPAYAHLISLLDLAEDHSTRADHPGRQRPSQISAPPQEPKKGKIPFS